MRISVVLPCRNEKAAVEGCIKQIKSVLKGESYEIIVSDSSNDGSDKIARKMGAKVVKHDKEGYGVAYLEGFKQARGDYIFMADCDGSYDFKEIPMFIEKLEEGYDLVVGNRFGGKISKGAMSFSHRYIGNPILSWILRLFYNLDVDDAHSGMRAIRRSAIKKLGLQTTGMEFASEMIMKAKREGLRISNLDINYHNRKGESKLRSVPDGWRHLRLMLIYSPFYLFFVPGLILFLLGLSSMIWIYSGLASLLGVNLYYHPLFLSSAFMILGYQLVIFALFAKSYAMNHLGEKSEFVEWISRIFGLNRATLVGGLVALFGILVYLFIFIKWAKSGFGNLAEEKNMIVALTCFIIGAQTIFSAFMLSILSIRK